MNRTSLPQAFLERFYPLPRPLRSIEDFDRHAHRDLAGLPDGDLARDGRCAQYRADLDANPDRRRWLAERVAAVREEIDNRARREGQQAARDASGNGVTWQGRRLTAPAGERAPASRRPPLSVRGGAGRP